MQTWCQEAAVKIGMIPTHARHYSKLVAQLICVLSIQTRSGLLCHLAFCFRQWSQWVEAFVIVVVVE